MNKKSRTNFLTQLHSNISELSKNELSIAIENWDILLEEVSHTLLRNKKLAMAFSLKDVSNFERLNDFHDNEDFVKELMLNHPIAYKYASKRVKNIQDIVESICFDNPQYFNLLPEKFKINKQLIYSTFENHTTEEGNASWLSVLEPVCSNKKLVKNILLTNKGIYKYLNTALKNDDEIIKLALKDFYMFKHLPDDKKENIEYMNLSCSISGFPIKDFSQKVLNSPQIMSSFLKRFPGAIFWCGGSIKDNEEIAIDICGQRLHPTPYSFFSEKVRSNSSIAEASLLANVSASQYLPDVLASDEKLVKVLIKNPKFNCECIHWFNDSIKNSLDVMKLAIKRDRQALKHVGTSLKNNKDFIEYLLPITEANMFSQVSKWRETFSLLSYREEDIKTFSVFLEKIQTHLTDKTYQEQSAAFKSFMKELKNTPLKEKLIEGDAIANYNSIVLKENLDSILSSKPKKIKTKI